MNIKRPQVMKKKGKRVGRGIGSGLGKTAGRGMKGQRARSGAAGLKFSFRNVTGVPLKRASYLKGISNPQNSRKNEHIGVNLDRLDSKFNAGETVDLCSLKEKGFIRDFKSPVKILGSGEITKKLTIKLQGITKSAKEKVEQAGGAFEETPMPKRQKKATEDDVKTASKDTQ